MKLTFRRHVERKWYWRVGRFEIQVGRLSRSIAVFRRKPWKRLFALDLRHR